MPRYLNFQEDENIFVPWWNSLDNAERQQIRGVATLSEASLCYPLFRLGERARRLERQNVKVYWDSLILTGSVIGTIRENTNLTLPQLGGRPKDPYVTTQPVIKPERLRLLLSFEVWPHDYDQFLYHMRTLLDIVDHRSNVLHLARITYLWFAPRYGDVMRRDLMRSYYATVVDTQARHAS